MLTDKCSVCSHEDRDEIDASLVQGRSLRSIARVHGVSKDALHRHKRNHVDRQLAVAVARRIEEGRAENLAHQMSEIRDAMQLLLDAAMAKGSFGGAALAAKELRLTLEALDRMLERERERQEIERRQAVETEAVSKDFDLGAELDALMRRAGFEDIGALDVEIRGLEAELAGEPPGLDLSLLDDDELETLHGLVSKASGGRTGA